MQQYYCNLFENKEDTLQSLNFENLGIKSNAKIPENIGIPLTVDEVGFVKVFWRQLKYFIVNAINNGFSKGCLSVSLRQCIITCLAKKDRSLIKKLAPHFPTECNLQASIRNHCRTA